MANLAITQQAGATALGTLQQEFAIYCGNGSFGVIDLKSLQPVASVKLAPRLVIFPRGEANTLLRRRIETLSVPVVTPKSVIESFWIDPATTVYENVTFSPGPTPASTLNLWIGPTITPTPGPWPIIEQFLREAICSGDAALYEYLIDLEAHALQKPQEKPGVIVILLGGQGVGKGTFETLLRRIWGSTTLLINKVDMIVGSFNGIMERAFNVFLDEAVFHGDRRSTEALKSVVTSEFVTINEKNQPARQIPSVHRFYAASNANHFAATENDDRRAVYVHVSDKYRGDHVFWDRAHQAIQGAEAEHFADFLLQRDISQFQPRQRPKSQELVRQRLLSLGGIEQYWYELLLDVGPVVQEAHRLTPTQWEDGQFVATRTLLDQYELFSRGTRSYRKVGSHDLRDALRKLCPSARSERKQLGGNRQHGYSLPSLTTARAEFEVFIGGVVSWPEN
jgi:hypothetical protein